MSVGAKIRSRRRQLGLTLEAVAQAADLPKPFLSQVEREKTSPSLTSLARIADALGISMDYFVASASGSEVVQKAESRRFFAIEKTDKRFAQLTGTLPNRQLEALLTCLPPGSSSEFTTHAGEEFFYVLQGKLHMDIGGQEVEICPGDSAHYQSTTPHRWENRGQDDVMLLWVGTPKLL